MSAARRRVLVIEGRSRKAVAVVRSLGRAGYEVHVTSRVPLAPARGSRWCARFFRHPDPERDQAAFLSFALGRVRSDRYDVVLPMESDALAVLSAHRAELPSGTAFPFAPDAVLRRAADKQQVMDLAESLDIPAPRSSRPESPAAALEAADRIGYPVILKPREGQGSHGVKLVQDRAELEASYPAIVARFGPTLIQEYVPPGGGEFGVSMLMGHAREVLARFSHRRLRSYPVAGGPSTLRESVRCPEAEAIAERLLRALEWEGVAMVEFRRDPRDGSFKLIEVNHRFWGSLQLAIVSGVDFPRLLCASALGETVTPVFEYRLGVQCRWLFPGDVMHFLSNPDRWRLNPSFFRFVGPELHYDIASLSDPGPGLLVLGDSLMQALDPARVRQVTRREGH